MSDSNDLVHHYDAAHRSFFDCVRTLSSDDLASTVPATPAWTVGDLIAHVVGVTADVSTGHGPSGSLDDWTAHQVAVRKGRSLESLLSEFDESAPVVRRFMNSGRVTDPRITANAFVHELDIRAAVPTPSVPDRETYGFTLTLGLEALRRRVADAELPGLQIAHDDETWVSAPMPETNLVATRYELHRALFGRRSIDQMQSFQWSGAPEPYVAVLAYFPPPSTDLLENSPFD